MSSNVKTNFFTHLLKVQNRFVWIAQQSNENTFDYIDRVSAVYQTYECAATFVLDKLKQSLIENKKREILATECLCTGLNKQVKRYMCKPEHYESYRKAISHVIQIQRQLNNLKSLNRISCFEDTLKDDTR